MTSVIIIGAGAAGLMAAISAADMGYKTLVLEKNEKPGKKLFITGKGRCNITNNVDTPDLINNIITNPKFLYSAFNEFNSKSMIDFLQKSGLKVKTERGNRVFPLSDKSSDVIKTLSNACKLRGVTIKYGISVDKIINTNDGFLIYSKDKKYTADKVIIATGGLSYPSTGSTGDGYRFAKDFNHDIVETSPSLTGFNILEDYTSKMMGLSLKNVTLELVINKKKIMKEMGEMLFTHYGISGPLVLSASEYYNHEIKKLKKKNVSEIKAKVIIDLKPALSEDELIKRIEKDMNIFKNSFFKNSLKKLLPSSMEEVIVNLSNIKEDKKAGEVNKKEIINLAHILKNLELNIMSLRGYDEAIITSGGISVKDINPKTMESKKVKGMYFAGEVIDVDALTGGFNLQIAWSTGYVAGKCM